MESAIPTHLRLACPRPRGMKDGHTPANASYVARFSPTVDRVVMAYFGIQYHGEEPEAAVEAIHTLDNEFAMTEGPRYWDRARFTDQAGFLNVVSAAYWDDSAPFSAWFARFKGGWLGGRGHRDNVGTYVEVFRPSVTGFETLFSSRDRPEGVAVLADHLSDEVVEHGYWGGMRDRLPRSQSNEMPPLGEPRFIQEGTRIAVVPHDGLCFIRSGQDWIDCDDQERTMYFGDVEPVLRTGMDFLRDDGLEIDCLYNRYVAVLGKDGLATGKTYGMSCWKSLAALETWAKSHPTHVKIFGAAMKHLTRLGPAAKLRLFHEVSVVAADEQHYEYSNCHRRTGLLNAMP